MIVKRVFGNVFRTLTIACFIAFTATNSIAQERVLTAGFQFKPIFSSEFFKTGPESATVQDVKFSITPKSGFCFGMVIRKGISNSVSIESGINFVKRNYSIQVSATDTTPAVDSNFKIVGYEIPVQALVFIRLSDFIYMDVALGASIDFYPSDIRTSNDYYEHYSARNSWFSPSVLANIGWEYRTEESGYFYLGASYHRPFESIYYSFIGAPDLDILNPVQTNPSLQLSGNYLTFDIRYFFHSDPAKRNKTKK